MGILDEDSLQAVSNSQENLLDAISLGMKLVDWREELANGCNFQTIEDKIISVKALSDREEFHTNACLRALDEVEISFNRLDTLSEHATLQVSLLGSIQENDLAELRTSFERFIDEGDEFMRLQQESGQGPVALGHSRNPIGSADRALRSFVENRGDQQTVLDRIIDNVHVTIRDNIRLAKGLIELIQDTDSQFSDLAEGGRPIEV
jgi:hypothetical protein